MIFTLLSVYNCTMKRKIITVILLFTSAAVFSQNMQSYLDEYTRLEGTFGQRLDLLESVRAAGMTGIGEFYHNALKYFFTRTTDIKTRTDQEIAERTVILLCQELGSEKYTAAAPEIWQVADFFDVAKGAIDGNTMQTALVALGDIDAKDFVPHIVQRLNNFNTDPKLNPENRRRIQVAAIGCIRALEALHDIRGYRPVFFVSVGTYDPPVRDIASASLPNIVDDPGDVLIEVIQDSSSTPRIKQTAWNEMLRTRAPESSKAKVAAAAIVASWNYSTNNQSYLKNLKDMRKSAIDVIRRYGVPDDSVYPYLERSYSSNFNNNAPDYDEIMLTLNALTAVKTDEAVGLLQKFLVEINERRRTGPWGNRERQLFEWVISCIGATGTRSVEIIVLLNAIERTTSYTPYERSMAANALRALGAR